ncbi:type VI secretion system Vgr family protein [Chondromyces apiculatus]|uniref:VgrG protein n=1 Tax=Chondromyces apiculatus DSM 436 TaxID=1192034 RepID=A0A017T566_9BACT|nr:type VI secretion system tip protein TssI/VgrG [Chondromyces apiculatus]EYF04379.1 VgrG protein [Chondromyces apiculatus DSM 436]
MPQLDLKVASGKTLHVRRFTVEEAVSSLFTVAVWARCDEPDLDLEGIIGQDASLSIVHGVVHIAGLGARTWTGICNHVEQAHGVAPLPGQKAESSYFLRIAPRAWVLTQRRNHRIFQHLSIPDILDKILDDWQLKRTWNVDRGSYPKLDYRVQYGESDYAFLSRLAEEAGIAFTFPDDGGSLITFGDKLHQGPKRGGQPLIYAEEPNQAAEKEFVTHVRISHEVRPGLHTIRDHDFRRPSYELFGQSAAAPSPEDRYEQYHYQPGGFLIETAKADGNTPVADDKSIARHEEPFGKARADRAILGRRAGKKQVAFDTNVSDLAPGAIFNVSQHPHPDLGEAADLLVLQCSISGTPGDEWQISGRAVFADTEYRPPLTTPKPRINNVQSAVVVGPAGQEIHVDEFGRVRVQFPWDREHLFNASVGYDRTCWMRVSQGWAGTGYGMIVIPRVGQEVLVGFIEGDPDHPIIVGRVFNATQGVPYKLPDHKTRSTWKSDSSLGGGGFNEIMFEDLKQKELVWMQAQKNLRKLVKNDEVITIGHDRRTYVVRDQTETTGVNRLEVTGVNRTEITDKDRTTFVGTNSLKMVRGDEHEKTDGNMMILIDKDQDIVVRQMKRERVEKDDNLYVVGDRNERVDGNFSVTVDKNHYEKISKNAAIEAGQQIHFKAGSAMVIEAAQDLTLKGPGGFVRIDASGVTIRGTLVRINSGGSAGDGEGANPILPEEAKLAVIEEPERPKPIDLRVDGIGQ